MSLLPTTNISRNFPGVDQKQYYTIDEIVEGDCGGTLGLNSANDKDPKADKQ